MPLGILRSPLFRPLATVILVVILAVSVLLVKNNITAMFQQSQQESDRYTHSPGCMPNQDQSQVNPSLPPCREITVAVIAKPENTTVDHFRYHDYSETHRQLTLRDSTGRTETVGDINEDMWNSVRIGDNISAQIWQGKVVDVSADGYSDSIFDEKSENASMSRADVWGIAAIACITLLRLLWRDPVKSFL